MEIHLKIIGICLILLSIMHVGFPTYFKWKKELASLSLINREMMYIHTLFIGIITLMMGILSFFYSSQMINLEFGRTIAAGLSIFWFIRLVVQFFGYSSKLWRGKKMETVIHVVFSIFWAYLSIIYLIVACNFNH